MTSRGTISRWFDAGVEDGHEYMIIKWDTFDGPDGDYPVYVPMGQDPHEVSRRNGDQTMECYDLTQDKTSQLNEHRAHHWDHKPITPQLSL